MELWEMSASEAVKAVNKKDIKVRELLESLLNRKEQTEGKLRAFLYTGGEEILEEADNLDREIEQGRSRDAVTGLPFTMSDDLCWKDTAATWGSEALQEYYPPFSSMSARRLSEKGALMWGKTNLDQWGMGSTTRDSSFQVTLNPWDPERVAGDGSASSLAAGSSFLSLVSDTGGRLRQSASYCGLAGLRPTPGLISKYGLMLFSPSFALVGLMARKVEDISLAMKTVSGFEENDAATEDCPLKMKVSLPNVGLRAGVPEKAWEGLEEKHYWLLKDAIGALSNEENSPVEKTAEVNLPHFGYGVQAYYIIAFAEASSQLARFDGIRFGRCHQGENLEEWYYQTRRLTFNREARRRTVIGNFFLNENNYEIYYSRALQVKTLVRNEMLEALQKHQILFLPVVPETAPLASGDEERNFLREYRRDYYCAPVSLAGLPSVVVPVGFVDNMPVGLQVVGSPYSEKWLLEVARWIEKEAGVNLPVKDI